MNIKYLFSILTTGLFILAGCSEENEVVNPTPPDQGGTDDPTRREVLLTLKNNPGPESSRYKSRRTDRDSCRELYLFVGCICLRIERREWYLYVPGTSLFPR